MYNKAIADFVYEFDDTGFYDESFLEKATMYEEDVEFIGPDFEREFMIRIENYADKHSVFYCNVRFEQI